MIGQRKLHTSHNHLGVSDDWWAGAVLDVSGPKDPLFCPSISRSKQASFHSFIFGLKKVLGFVHLGWASNLREVKPKPQPFTSHLSHIKPHKFTLYFYIFVLLNLFSFSLIISNQSFNINTFLKIKQIKFLSEVKHL